METNDNLEQIEDITQIEFTQHVLERYVERTMNKTGTELKQYLVQNEELVKQRILELYEYSEPIWAGKTKKHNFAYFRINKNGWIFVIDKNKTKLITIYKVDLGLGEEFNKKYVEEIKKVIKENIDFLQTEKTKLEETKTKADMEIDSLKKDNEILNAHIQTNTNTIKILKESTDNEYEKLKCQEEEFKRKIERFVGTKIF